MIDQLGPGILAKYAGTYEFAPGHDAEITIEADLLFLRQGANPLKLPLVANSENVFVSRTNGDWIEFKRMRRAAFPGSRTRPELTEPGDFIRDEVKVVAFCWSWWVPTKK